MGFTYRGNDFLKTIINRLGKVSKNTFVFKRTVLIGCGGSHL